jgi:hypothetical protein
MTVPSSKSRKGDLLVNPHLSPPPRRGGGRRRGIERFGTSGTSGTTGTSFRY